MSELREHIAHWAAGREVYGKEGSRILQPALAEYLNGVGYTVDLEDSRCFLGAGLPVWRSKDDRRIIPTPRRRKIDLVVYLGDSLAGLIEIESDLNDLRVSGVTKRNGHYDVYSIARRASGDYFHSYNSLERMAAAAYYAFLSPTLDAAGIKLAVSRLKELRSDSPVDHNPLSIELNLVSGVSRRTDAEILQPRLNSLDAKLFSVTLR